MNWDRIKSEWPQFRKQVVQQWGRLSDDDLDVIDGQRQLLSGRLQETYGISKDEAERQIKRFEDQLGKGESRTDRRPGSETHTLPR